MQSPESINLELLDEMTSLTNGLMGIANGPKGSGQGDTASSMKDQLN
jgi:Tfp pilus assembly pilus retraction ATPase PilT